MIEIFAPSGIAEVTDGDDVAGIIIAAIRSTEPGSLHHGDIVAVTSKIISKAEGRSAATDQRQAAIDSQTVRTLTRRRSMAIVETPQGLVQAGAGVDDSNVALGQILLLPEDPDASAERLRSRLAEAFDVEIGVIISDTAGRTWRLGQTDHAIGASGVRVLNGYAGRQDEYGNELQVTAIAIADELAAAADLAKQKLSGRPVAVVRGAGEHLLTGDVNDADAADTPPDQPPSQARDLQRQEDDLFHRGSRESVLWAVLEAVGRPERYEAIVRLEDRAELTEAITAELDLSESARRLIHKIVTAAQPLWP